MKRKSATRSKKLRIFMIYEEALNNIACWNDGPSVSGKFDEPGSAFAAREALKKAEEISTSTVRKPKGT